MKERCLCSTIMSCSGGELGVRCWNEDRGSDTWFLLRILVVSTLHMLSVIPTVIQEGAQLQGTWLWEIIECSSCWWPEFVWRLKAKWRHVLLSVLVKSLLWISKSTSHACGNPLFRWRKGSPCMEGLCWSALTPPPLELAVTRTPLNSLYHTYQSTR